MTVLCFFILSPKICHGLDTIHIGSHAPHFALKDLSDNTIFLKTYCGDSLNGPGESHVIILSFFATWCIPCQSELPILEKFYQDFQHEKINVFLINTGEKKDKVIQYQISKDIHLPVLLDSYLTTSKNYGVVNQNGKMTLPQLFIIDRNGILRYYQIGFQEDVDLRKLLLQKVGELLN